MKQAECSHSALPTERRCYRVIMPVILIIAEYGVMTIMTNITNNKVKVSSLPQSFDTL